MIVSGFKSASILGSVKEEWGAAVLLRLSCWGWSVRLEWEAGVWGWSGRLQCEAGVWGCSVRLEWEAAVRGCSVRLECEAGVWGCSVGLQCACVWGSGGTQTFPTQPLNPAESDPCRNLLTAPEGISVWAERLSCSAEAFSVLQQHAGIPSSQCWLKSLDMYLRQDW